MALHDRPVRPDRGTPEFAAAEVRRGFAQSLDQAKHALTRIKSQYDTHGAALTTALGADGSDLTASYNALKAMVEALDNAYTVPDLE